MDPETKDMSIGFKVGGEEPVEVGRFFVECANGQFSVRIRENATVYLLWTIHFLSIEPKDQFKVLNDKSRIQVSLVTDSGLIACTARTGGAYAGCLHEADGSEAFTFNGARLADVREIQVVVDQRTLRFPAPR